MKIIVADDEAVSRRLTQHTLERAGYDVVPLENGHLAAEHLLRPRGPRLAVLDWVMPGLDGPGVCRVIRAVADQPYVYIVLLTSKESKKDLVAGLEAGADDYLTKPCNPEELKARLRSGQRILQLQDTLFHDARHDALTQLPNRACLLDQLNRCVHRAGKDPNYKFAVLFVDLDRFKSVNDTLGHSAGDELITHVAERLLRSIDRVPVSQTSRMTESVPTPTDDMVARMGGDEFIVLLNDVRDGADAVRIAGRIQYELGLPFSIAGCRVQISASIGVSLSASGLRNAEEMLRDADSAMYRAKLNGQLVISGETSRYHRQAPAHTARHSASCHI